MMKNKWVKSTSNAIAMGASIVVPFMGNACFAQTTPRTITTNADVPSYAAFRPYWVDRPVMEVIGRATRELPPNSATMSFKFESTEILANDALTKVTRAARGAIERVQRLAGTKAEVTATSSRQDFYQQYRDRTGNRIENARPDKLERSTITWIVTIKLTDVTLVPRVRAEMLNGVGSSEYGGVQFSLIPTEAQMRDVLALALDDGKERARIMSALHGGRTRLLVVQEGTGQCVSQQATPTGYAAYAAAPPPPPPPPPPAPPPPPNDDGTYSRNSSELILPAAPSPTSIASTVCLLYGLD